MSRVIPYIKSFKTLYAKYYVSLMDIYIYIDSENAQTSKGLIYTKFRNSSYLWEGRE